MTIDETPLFIHLAAAYVRGTLAASNATLLDASLNMLDDAVCAELIARGRVAGLRLHRFKRTMSLPRVERVLGMLAGLAPSELLDIGPGRGAFLWPLLDAFPTLPVTIVERRADRVAQLAAVACGGVATLTVHHGDVCALPFAPDTFAVVTMLEVLEHIPVPEAALAEVCRVARDFVAISVPAKADTNPEHLHLFTADRLTMMLRTAGAHRVSFMSVPGHLLALARVHA